MRTIIAATDFSPAASNAVNYAKAMAKTLGAELLLFNVYNLPVNYADGVLYAPLDEIQAGSQLELENLKNQIVSAGGPLQVTVCSRMGNIVDELENLCKTKKRFAVIIGTKGHTNLETTEFGSSTLSIIRHLDWPVICVPPGTTYGRGIHKVGLACDLSDVALTVPARQIREFIKEFQPELHILNVNYKDKKFRPSTPEDSFTLHHLFEKERPQYHYIDNPNIEVGIFQFVKDQELDLLITIPKKHKFLEKIFRKSTTKKLVSAASSPLVCIHA